MCAKCNKPYSYDQPAMIKLIHRLSIGVDTRTDELCVTCYAEYLAWLDREERLNNGG